MPKAAEPDGLDLGKTNTHAEGEILPFALGWWRLPLIWIAGPWDTYKRGGKKSDPDWYFSNVAAVVTGNPVDEVQMVMANELPVAVRANNLQPYYDWTDQGGPMDVENGGRWRFHGGDATRKANRLLTSAERDGVDYPLPRHCLLIEALRMGHVYNAENRLPVYNVVGAARPRVPDEFASAGLDLSLQGNGVNPISAAVALACDEISGAGMRARQFDIPFVVARAAELGGNDHAISPVFQTRQRLDQTLEDLFRYFDGWARKRQGLWQIGFQPEEGYAPGEPGDGTVTLLDPSSLTKTPEVGPKRQEEMPRLISSTMTDRTDYAYKASEPAAVRSPLLLRRDGAGNQTVDAAFIVDVAQHHRFLQRYGAAVWTKGHEASDIAVRRERAVNPDGSPIGLGDVFWLAPPAGGRAFAIFVNQPVRYRYGGEVELAGESARGTYPALPPPEVEARPDRSLPDVSPFAAVRLVEASFPLRDTAAVAVFALLARGNARHLDGQLWYGGDDGAAYGEGPRLPVTGFGLQGTLDSALAADGVFATVTLDAAMIPEDFGLLTTQNATEQTDDTLIALIGPAAAGGWAQGVYDVASIGTVTPVDVDTFTLALQRGRQGTLPLDHAAGAHLWIIARADLDLMRHAALAPGSPAVFKVQPRDIHYSVIELANVPAETLTFAPPEFDDPVLLLDMTGDLADADGDGIVDVPILQGSIIEIQGAVTDAAGNLVRVSAYLRLWMGQPTGGADNRGLLFSETIAPTDRFDFRREEQLRGPGAYELEVRAEDTRGASSEQVATLRLNMVPLGAPGAPVRLEGGGERVIFTFTGVEGTNTDVYYARLSVDGETYEAPVFVQKVESTTPVNVFALRFPALGTYRVFLRAELNDLQGPDSEAYVHVFAAPSAGNLFSLTVTGLSYTLEWTDPDGDLDTHETEILIRATGQPDWETIALVGVGQNTYAGTIPGLEAFDVAIRHVLTGVRGVVSNLRSLQYLPLSAPSGLTAVASGQNITFSWAALSGAARYEIQTRDASRVPQEWEVLTATSFPETVGYDAYREARVRAIDGIGVDGAWTVYVGTTTGNAPF